MSNNNNSGNFFKFKNVQLVRRPNSGRQTRQNTEIRMQGTAGEQFVGIAAAGHAEALNDIDDILTDDDSVDYSLPNQQPLQPQVQVQNTVQSVSDSDELSNNTPESVTDSSLDTSSIEEIQPNEGNKTRLPKTNHKGHRQTLLQVQGQMLQSPYQTIFLPKMKKQETKLCHPL